MHNRQKSFGKRELRSLKPLLPELCHRQGTVWARIAAYASKGVGAGSENLSAGKVA